MGVIWWNSLMTANCSVISGFGIPGEVSIDLNEDVTPEDDLSGNSDLDAFPTRVSEPWEMYFQPQFP